MSEKVKFYRGKSWDPSKQGEPSEQGEIVFINDAFEKDLEPNKYNEAKKFGSIYQDDKIVGTTRAEKLMTTEDITVAGGPLADDLDDTLWPSDEGWKVDGNKTIPAGTSIQTILEKLFLQVVNGTAVWGEPTWSTTPSYGNPTVSLSQDGNVEYGTELTVNTLTAGATTKGNRRVVCTCNQGYFEEDSDTWVNGNKTLNAEPTISGEQTLTATWNGKDVSNFAKDVKVIADVLGENKLVVTQSGQTVKHTAGSFDGYPYTVYASTNTKKKLGASTFNDDVDASKTLSSSSSDKVNAYYKYFYFTTTTAPTSLTEIPNGASSSFLTGYTDGATTKTTSGTVFFNVGATINAYILMPEGYELTQILYSDGSICDGFTLRNNKFSYTLPNNSTVSYNIYCWENKGDGTADLRDMIITKKTSNN